jgi:hypothetical protein
MESLAYNDAIGHVKRKKSDKILLLKRSVFGLENKACNNQEDA